MSQNLDGALFTDFVKSYTTWDIITNISALLQLRKKWIFTKVLEYSSKILQHLIEILHIICRKYIFVVPRTFKFGTKWVVIEVHNKWKFGVDFSNHAREVQNWIFWTFKFFEQVRVTIEVCHIINLKIKLHVIMNLKLWHNAIQTHSFFKACVNKS